LIARHHLGVNPFVVYGMRLAQIKRSMLIDLVEYISSNRGVINEPLYQEGVSTSPRPAPPALLAAAGNAWLTVG
jgi:hypothetical protein